MSERLYRGPQVCRAAGITYRQLDYWARTGLAEPTYPARGSGSQRLYTEHDVSVVMLVADLLRAGMSLQAARRATTVLAELPAELWEGLGPVAVTSAGDVYLDGACTAPVYMVVDLAAMSPGRRQQQVDAALVAVSA